MSDTTILSVRLDKELKDAFFEMLEHEGKTPSKVIRILIKAYIDGEADE
jgi:antitoxin component of RelBE/YafQ-DinJ toxin-antitoxin module